MEFQKKRLALATASLFAVTMLSGCDWFSDDKKDDGLVCTAPQVPNDAGDACVDPAAELVQLSENQVAIYYKRPAATAINEGDYEGWGLHLWNNETCDSLADSTLAGVEWATPKLPTGFSDTYGAYYVLDLKPNHGTCINFILHNGDEKALGAADKQFDLTQPSQYAFTFHGNPELFYEAIENPPVTLEGAAAHWVSDDTLIWDAPAGTATAALLHSADASIALSANGELTGTYESTPLTVGAGVSNDLKAKFPHLASMAGHGVTLTADEAKAALKQQLVVAAFDADGKVLKATRVQIPGVIDDLYTSGENDANEAQLGAIVSDSAVTFKLWAPTATSVKLHLYDADKVEMGEAVTMTLDAATGIWSYAGATDLVGAFYKYEVAVYHPTTGANEDLMVTDPYSLSLSTNSVYSQVVDLNDPALFPAGWDADYTSPAPTNFVVYESHIRDFSALDESTTAANRGKYLAFTETTSAPMQHLAALKEAGLTYVQLLPAFDIATINEDPAMRVDITDTVAKLCTVNANAAACSDGTDSAAVIKDLLAAMDPESSDAQALMADIRGYDSFNWGYDPFHYGVPEGSYSSNPDGTTRILEFRTMVKALHDEGLGVVMDVVYNHTNAAGVDAKSVLDKVVPGYYQRLDVTTGEVTNSTCCSNTANEHVMMAKLMKDTLVTWTRDYKIDSFRFDLMGHQPLAAMEDALAATQEVDPNMYFYGEGWNFGEVASDARFVQATQLNLGGSGIGSFSDRLRDAVRGGSPFDSGDGIRAAQGFANGLYNDPNEMNSGSDGEKATLLRLSDQIMVELAGGLEDYALIDHTGETVRGKNVDYNGQPSGYTQSPMELVTYVSKHDNQTLWDNNQYKLPTDMTAHERARAQVFALSFPALGQGVPFIHMGSDLLRSKSMERDSYDSGDWYNTVDFTGASNHWNVGLPREDKDGGNWSLIGSIISNPNTAPGAAEIEHATKVFQELLAIRAESKLFHLGSKEEIMNRIDFHNTGPDQTPGVIVMSIDDGASAGDDLDADKDAVVVVFNGGKEAYTKDLGIAGLELHEIQAASFDATYGDVTIDGTTISVPGYTTAVFVLPQGAERGAGVPVVAKSFANYRAFGDEKVYARGAFNDWGTTDQAKFTGTGTYTAVVDVAAAGDYAFKFASSDWDTVDVGFSKVTATEDSLAIADNGGNISASFPAAGLYSLKLDAANDGAYTVTIKAYEDVAPFANPAYIRGFMGDWSAVAERVMEYQGLGVYSVTIDPAVTEQTATEFKVAAADWGDSGGPNYGAVDDDNKTIVWGAPTVMGGGPNFAMTVDPDYSYTFTVDMFYPAEPTVTVTRTSTAPAPTCELLADSAEAGPISAALAIRGAHSSWNWNAAYELTYKGNNTYQVATSALDLTGGFKLAGDTSNWDPQFIAFSGGALATGMQPDVTYDVKARIGSSTIADPGNNTMDLTDGDYIMTFKVTGDVADAAIVGELSVCQPVL